MSKINTIEQLTAKDDSLFIATLKNIEPSLPFAVLDFPGGASVVGPGPFTNTFGFGRDDPQLSLLSKIERFFLDHKTNPTITIKPEAVTQDLLISTYGRTTLDSCFAEVSFTSLV